MRREKRRNTYFGFIGAVIFSTILMACGVQGEDASEVSHENPGEVHNEKADTGDTEVVEAAQRPSETYSCSVQELSSYLQNYRTDCSYVSADITLSGYSGGLPEPNKTLRWDLSLATGDAEVIWQFYNSLEQMEQELQMREGNRTDNTGEEEKDDAEADENIRLLYCMFPLPEDAHAFDIYHTLEERYGTAEQPVVALDRGKFYYFTQVEAGEYELVGATDSHYRFAINLFIMDRFAYALIPKNIPDTYSDRELNLLFSDYVRSFVGNSDSSILHLMEERLYWVDHEERITVMEKPNRSFVEIRGISEQEEMIGYKGIRSYFGMLKEADYEVPLTEDGSMLEIHFSFAEDPSVTEYRVFLMRGRCKQKDYNMTVTDKESGKILQEDTMALCIELPDTITFEDLNADGYIDMVVDRPTHDNGDNPNYSRMIANQSDWEEPFYRLWNPQAERFERHMEYTVQPGDSLWSISEQFLESGLYWTMLKRKGNAPEDPDYLLPGEKVYVPWKMYIRKVFYE